jgi:YaiO family outer membrane protein
VSVALLAALALAGAAQVGPAPAPGTTSAVEASRSATERTPDDADAWLALGLSLMRAERFAEAEPALAQALRLAPGYTDAQVALARLSFFRGDLTEAEARLAPAVAADPDHAEARALHAQLRAARSPVPATPWRVDLWSSYSGLSAGLDPWREHGAALSRRVGLGAVSASAQHTRRFGRDDLYLEAGAERAGPRGSAYAALGGAADADHRAELALRAGGEVAVGRGLRATLDGGYARFGSGEIVTFHSGAVGTIGPVRLSGRWINLWPEEGSRLSGYATAAELTARPGLRLTVGYADAPETSEGRPVPVEALSLGAAADLSDRLTLRMTGVSEERPGYSRDELALGLAARF